MLERVSHPMPHGLHERLAIVVREATRRERIEKVDVDHTRPDAAILDTELADGTCRDVARVLAHCAVPFVIYSGHRQDKDLLAEFHTAVWIEKPAPSFDLIAACRQLIAATS